MMSKTAAIIAAAGKSRRTGGRNKLFECLDDTPILIHSINAMCKSFMVDCVIIVTREEYMGLIEMLCNKHKVSKPFMVVEGGSTRPKSVLLGIKALVDKYKDEYKYVAIHDGARPFTKTELIDRVITEAIKNGAAIPAVRVTDTIKRVANGLVLETIPREELYAAQTPQVFDLQLYLSSVQEGSEDITDDSLLFERAGIPVKIVDGDYKNIKITTPDDFISAQVIYDAEKELCTE